MSGVILSELIPDSAERPQELNVRPVALKGNVRMKKALLSTKNFEVEWCVCM